MASKQTGRGGSSPTPQEGGKAVKATGQEKDTMVDENTERILAALRVQSEKFGEKFQSLEDLIQKKNDETAKEIERVANVLSEALLVVDEKAEEAVNNINKLDIKIKQTDIKVDNVENLALKLENEITMVQFRSMECAVRLRGIQERVKEDLVKICSKGLAKLLNASEEQVAYRIAKIYRANSLYARQRQLPRDVVIYFTDTVIRNDVISKSYVEVMLIEGKEIRVFKEIPPRMLRLRKEFQFLVVELKKQSIVFRWEAPMGISFNYKNQFYRLTTVEKARAFYSDVWKGNNNTSSSPELVSKENVEEELNKESNLETQQKLAETTLNETLGAIGGQELLVDFTPCPVTQFEEQRSKRQRQQQKKPKEPHTYHLRSGVPTQKQQTEETILQDNLQLEIIEPQVLEAVGGARQKDDRKIHQVLAKLRSPQDGN